MTNYIILENLDEYQYKVVAIIHSNIQDAYKAYFIMHVEKILEINRFCNFNSNLLLVEVNDIVQAIEQTWKVLINSNDDMLIKKYDEYLDEDLRRKYKIFLEQSKEYEKQLYRNFL